MKGKLLVVDDEVAITILLRDNFEAEDYLVIEAFNGASAIEKASSEKPDLIILDINMPEMNGLEACRRLKENAATQGIPIIMLSAYSQEADIQRSLDHGAAAHMTKPFTLEGITMAVEKLLAAPPIPPA